jgi:antirestriction protein
MNIKKTQNSQDKLPAIWVGDLGDYNAGILNGEWIMIDECTTVESIHEQIQEILKRGITDDSPHEEWIICDYNNLPLSDSYTPLSNVVAVAELVRSHGYEVAKAYLEHFDIDSLGKFEERFIGVYDSTEDYVRELLDDGYAVKDLLGDLADYFDYKQYAEDMEGNNFLSESIDSGKVAIFYSS